MGKRHIYRIESADVLNFCDRVRTVWERSRELSADVVAAERERDMSETMVVCASLGIGSFWAWG